MNGGPGAVSHTVYPTEKQGVVAHGAFWIYVSGKNVFTFTLHPDIVGVIRSIATEEDIPMNVVAYETMYAGLKKMGRMD